MSGCEDTERRESGLSYTPPPGQTGQGDIVHTHKHNLRCVRKWHQSACPDPHTSTSCHFSLISPVPAAPYRNRLSQKLAVHFRSIPKYVLSILFKATRVGQIMSQNTIFFSENVQLFKQDKSSFLMSLHIFFFLQLLFEKGTKRTRNNFILRNCFNKFVLSVQSGSMPFCTFLCLCIKLID